MPSVLLCNQALGMIFAKKRSGEKMHKRILGANNGIKSGKRSKKCSKLIKKTYKTGYFSPLLIKNTKYYYL